MSYTAPRVRVVRRGRDRHLHGQVYLPPGSTQTSFAATSCRTTVHQREKGAIHETGYGTQVLGLHAPQARLFAIVLPLCLMFFLTWAA